MKSRFTVIRSRLPRFRNAEFTRIPNDEKDLTPEQRATIDKMVERLEEDEDVQNVYTNMKPADNEGEE